MQICPYKENKVGKCLEGSNFICEKDSADTCWIYYSKLLDKQKFINLILQRQLDEMLVTLEQKSNETTSYIVKAQDIVDSFKCHTPDFILAISDLAKILSVNVSTLSAILGRSHYHEFETRTKIMTCEGKTHSARAYRINSAFLNQLDKDLKNIRTKKSM